VKLDIDMSNTDTLHNSHPKSTLEELLTRGKAGAERPGPLHHRRADDQLVESERESSVAPSGVVLEPVVERKPYDLTYSCLLIPRFSAHYLIGDIAESLREWMHQVCISFAWRLHELRIRPEYMEWVLYVPPATSPTRCIRTVREHTSRFIFEDFPHIRRENISNDFWAPGYLVTVGPTLLPPEKINEFISLTRQQQGTQPRRFDE
jgi:putative transposase